MNNIHMFFLCFIMALNLISFSGYAITNNSENLIIGYGAGPGPAPDQPTLISPENDSEIAFKFIINGGPGNNKLKARLQLSTNNFQDVWKTFDQTQDQTGWSRSFYESGNIASFTLPAGLQLEPGKTYWWRTYALKGELWSPASEVRTFSLANTMVFEYVRFVPNPAVSRSRIRIYVRLAVDADITIRFYNKLGREIDILHAQATDRADGNRFRHNISGYASGIYFYVIEARSALGKEKITGQFAVVD
jgi:hypothetical protein